MTLSLRSRVSLFATTLALASTAGCSGGNTNSTPTSNDYDDVAQSLTAVVTVHGGGGELGSMADTASIAVGATPNDVAVDAQGSFDAARAGLHYSYKVTCTDASGAALARCDRTADAADATVSWNGSLTLPELTASVERSGHWTLTGVQSGTGTLNGDGTFTFDAQFTSMFRHDQGTAHLSFTSSYDAVRIDAAEHRPVGGTVHYAVQASHQGTSGSASFAIDAVLTFAADGSAKLVLDGTHAYAISATGWVVKA